MQGTSKKYIKILSLFLLIVGCSEDTRDFTSEYPLTYSFTAESESRAISSTFTDYTGTEFGVYATDYTPDYASAPNSNIKLMENVKVTYDGGNCSTDDTHYWTSGEVHFAAYSPYVIDPSADAVKITVPTTPYAGYSFAGAVEGRTNYMFADEELGKLTDFTAGVVPLKFRHAVSKLTFAVRLSDSQDGAVKLNLKSLQLANIRYSGNVDFTHNGKTSYAEVTAASLQNKWVASNADDVWNTKEFPIGSSFDNGYMKSLTVNTAGLNSITDEEAHDADDCLYLMPQILYLPAGSQYAQTITVEYEITIKGATTSYSRTIPLYKNEIPKWTINKHIHYTIGIQPPGGEATLDVEVQPWNLEERTNEFSDIVTIDNENDRIKWTEGSYQTLSVSADKNELIIKPDVNIKPEFRFKIGHPLGATWYATLRTQSGDPNAFKLVSVNGATIVDGVALGAVGDEVKLCIQATDPNPMSTNIAELYFVVRCNGQILPVDILTANNKNFTIIQNINI